jgi:hypothetical protein
MDCRPTLTIFFLSLIVFAGCPNQPPSSPILIGPQRCRPNDTLTFSVISVDKEGDSVAYLFECNQQLTEWTQWFPAGIEVYQRFSFGDTGNYILRVKAKDSRHESNWSDEFPVSVRWYLPSTPRRPSGPDSVAAGDTVTFYTSALHPLNQLVAFQFLWGGSTGDWSGFVLPGTIVAIRHAFDSVGIFEVRCRAKDKKGYVSEWSLPETVFVRERGL